MCWLSVHLLFFTLVTIKCQAWVVDDQGCRTPDRGVGDCLPVKQCAPMVTFLQNSTKPITRKVKDKLNAYICSYKSNIVWVCCPRHPIIISVETKPTPRVAVVDRKPPDVSGHKNLNLLSEECGFIDSREKIRNGKDAFIDEFPWMALLSYNTARGPNFWCGGTVINEKYILTAAHCISNLTSPPIGVRVGEYNILTSRDCQVKPDGSQNCIGPVQDLVIEEMIPHPEFNLNVIQNDIGLLRISKINMSVDNVRPICLPVNEETREATFKYGTISGWGITDPYKGESSMVLQKVDLPIVSLDVCSDNYRKESAAKITKKHICAGDIDQKDSCRGDSGGPLQVAAYFNDAARYVQQGIISYGHYRCGENGYPGVLTRVSYYMDWILDNIRP